MRDFAAGPALGAVHRLGEGPRWDDRHETISWVDIVNGHVFQGVLAGDDVRVTHRFDFPATAGAASPTSDGGLVVAAHDRLVVVSPDGARRSGAPLVDAAALLRFNDAAVDPAGRLLAGTLATDGRWGAAQLFTVEPDGTSALLRDGLNLANGIGWSPDGTTLYLADSEPGCVWSASYDVGTGRARDWTPLVTEFDGVPDGLVVDAEGLIWVAVWGGAQVRCFAPSGESLAVVRLPVPQVTAVAFVGPDRDRMLITSAWDGLDDAARARHPDSGRLFLADVGARGLPTSLFTPDPTFGTPETS